MPEKFNIRLANANDAEELLKIYTPYVTDTAITFEYDVPSLEEFTQRIINISKKYPYIVAERGGEIVGYAYAGAFKERAAYDWAVETTIYVKQDCTASGIGRKLYAVLEKLLGKQGILNLNACIAYTETEDEHLTNGSMAFHNKLGYKLVGTFHKCGYKFSHWYDMIWMEKFIGKHTETQSPVIDFRKIKSDLGAEFFAE